MIINFKSINYFKIVKLVLLLVIFNGVIVALIKFFGVTLPISLITITILLFFPLVILRMMYAMKNNISNLFMDVLIILFSILFFAKLIVFSNELNTNSLSLTLIYIMSIFYFYLTIGLDKEKSIYLIRFISLLGFFIVMFAYMQYFFHDILPTVFVELPRIDSATISCDYIREIDDLIIFRPNGLIGNPITFGFFILLLLNINLYFYSIDKRKVYLFSFLLGVIMILLLTSRANIVALTIIISVFIYQKKGFNKLILYSSVIGTVIFTVIVLMYEKLPFIKFLIDRFTGEDTYAEASTAEHIHDYINAINALLDSPIVGIPIGVYTGKSMIITDGAWFSLALKFGLIIFLIIFLIWILNLKTVWKLSQKKKYNGLLFPFFLTITLTNFLNSAMLAKPMYVLVWILFGLIYNLNYLEKQERINNAK